MCTTCRDVILTKLKIVNKKNHEKKQTFQNKNIIFSINFDNIFYKPQQFAIHKKY